MQEKKEGELRLKFYSCRPHRKFHLFAAALKFSVPDPHLCDEILPPPLLVLPHTGSRYPCLACLNSKHAVAASSHRNCGKIPNAPSRNVLYRRTSAVDEFRRICAINLAEDRNFKYFLTNKKVKYASNFNDQGFLC